MLERALDDIDQSPRLFLPFRSVINEMITLLIFRVIFKSRNGDAGVLWFFDLLRFVIGQENWRHALKQSNAK